MYLMTKTTRKKRKKKKKKRKKKEKKRALTTLYLHISTAFVARRIPAPTSLSLSAPPSHAKVFSKQNRPLSWARPLPARSFRVRRDTLLYSTLLYSISISIRGACDLTEPSSLRISPGWGGFVARDLPLSRAEEMANCNPALPRTTCPPRTHSELAGSSR